MLEKHFRLVATYRFDPDWAWFELNGAQGWAYHAWATEQQATMFGASFERTTKGYVGQEVERLKSNG